MRGSGLIILAAGSSSRMGRPKQLLPWKGRTLLRHAVETALGTSLRPVFVVLGCEADLCRRELEGLDVTPVTNANWARGMGASVATGIAALEKQTPDAAGALLMLADQPDVTADFLESMHARWSAEKLPIVATEYPHGGGVPALFSRNFFAELQTLDADRGARQIINRERAGTTFLQPKVEFADLDTPEDHLSRTADYKGRSD